MYLKQLDILGFKSFADKTRLTFDPGMIAIVGPNGCGKSNVSDSIRWVLGEQRPSALRCSKLSDVVFNGTDTRKPLGFAEVSITFADCEKELGTDYHEVTVTRRVYRDGGGEYFINKTKCGLKDIKRLFMGTGIGTTSYSVMAQGQIDAILSSKPEDRRAVFEEAAGITKFKADRKEALRKIEQTEQNLLREADVLREMKRQIGSLQRQVGKAQHYKELRDELRSLDIYVCKGKIMAFNMALEMNVQKQHETEQEIANAAEAVNNAEQVAQQLHTDIHAIEERLAQLATEAASAESNYRRAREVIAVNEQRITEYKMFSDRDGREIAHAKEQFEELTMQSESLVQKTALLEEGLAAAREALDEADALFQASSDKIEELRASLQEARSESVSCDGRSAKLRDEIAALEAQQREAIMKRERLNAELSRLTETVTEAQAALDEVKARLESAKAAEEDATAQAQTAEDERASLAAELEDLRTNFGKMQQEAAAKEAQLDLLNDTKDSADAFAAGAQKLLNGECDEVTVVGALADKFSAPSEYRLALEAALRSWLDAVIVQDAASAMLAVEKLLANDGGSVRIVPSKIEGSKAKVEVPPDLKRLLDSITVSDDFKEAAEALLGDVYVGEAACNGVRVVTLRGVVYNADGTCELWMPGTAAASPLSRRMMITETEAELAELKTKIDNGRRTLETGAEKSAALNEQVRAAQAALANARRAAAQAEGEYGSLLRDAESEKARLATVQAEFDSIKSATSDDEAKRTALADELEQTLARRDLLMEQTAKRQEELQQLEIEHSNSSRALTEKRITAAQMESELQLTSRQSADVIKRQEEIKQMIEGREEGQRSYEDSIQRLREESAELMASLDELRDAANVVQRKINAEKATCSEMQDRLAVAEGTTSGKRIALDKAREMKGKLELAASEAQMRRQNVYDHLYQEYSLNANDVTRESDPEWKGGKAPPQEEVEAKVEKLQAEITALGPVNLVAIDDYRELEERYTKEKEQEADLLAAKEQIVALINDLNGKSGELFRTTFSQANENFQKMFTRLFNGGEARLVLLENAEDPLECGIDIIARPPGKRPQSVTLLSGGERTMTAVALLFAIFAIKPAPFTMLDELDAALDDANIGRFVDALKDFLDRSQFLIITHNQHTIAGSDLVYGVSQQEKGVSRILSMRLADIGVKNVK